MSDPVTLIPNATDLERALDLAGAARLDAIPVPLGTLWRPEACPANLLPWLAWAFSVDEWDETWSEAVKRQVIDASVEVHRKKGTIGAVKRALAAVDYRVDIVEWWQTDPPGPRFTFSVDVEVENRGIDGDTQNQIIRIINSAKNVRSHIAALRLIGASHSRPYFATWVVSSAVVELLPYQITHSEVAGSAYFAICFMTYNTVSLYPEGS